MGGSFDVVAILQSGAWYPYDSTFQTTRRFGYGYGNGDGFAEVSFGVRLSHVNIVHRHDSDQSASAFDRAGMSEV